MTGRSGLLDLSPYNPVLVSGGTATVILSALAWRRRFGKLATADYITVRSFMLLPF